LTARFDFLLQCYTNNGHTSVQISGITRHIFIQKVQKLGFMFGVSGVESTGILRTMMIYYKQMYKILHWEFIHRLLQFQNTHCDL